MARLIDRLPDGRYSISLVKVRRSTWVMDITGSGEIVRSYTLSRKRRF